MGNAIDNMTYHRGFSHSLLVLTAASPAIAYGVALGFGRWLPGVRQHWRRFMATIWLCLVTHPLLDSLTTYGTQIFWPLEIGPPVAFPSVFIIDPLYTSLLLIGVLAMVFRRRMGGGVAANRALLLAGTLYLGAGMAGHLMVEARAQGHPAFQGMRVHVQPTPFNILYWQVLGVNGSEYVSGLASLVGACSITRVARYDRHAAPPGGLEPSPSARRLEWFTDGFYSYENGGDTIRVHDLRIGFPPGFVFSFDVGRGNGRGFDAIVPTRAEVDTPRPQQVRELFDTISRSLDTCGA
jgi:inner membrane protein